MADKEIRIWAPVPNGATPTEAVLVTFADASNYQRWRFGWQAYEGHTPFGTAIVSGAYRRPKHRYRLLFTEQDDVYRQVCDLMLWQQMERAARRPGQLSLSDECLDFEPEPAPHSKTLLTTKTNATGWVYGKGTINSVLVTQPDGEGFTYAGYDRNTNQPYKLFQIEVTEL